MANKKSVLIVGGTGFIGYHATLEFLKKDYRVTVLSLPPTPPKSLFPPEVKIILGDIGKLTDAGLSRIISGHHTVVFAAGADDRVTPPRPAYPFFYKNNVENARRFFKAAAASGVKKGVVLSSYFLYFDRHWPELELSRNHPYVRSRREQAKTIIATCGNDIDVSVLELPYIFGSMPGRKPLWCPLIQYIKSSSIIYYTHGGTNCIAVEHVAEAVVGAIEKGKAGEHYTVGDENMTWTMMLRRIMKQMGVNKKIVLVPNWLAKFASIFVKLRHIIKGQEGGLDPVGFIDVQTRNTFFDAGVARRELGFGKGGLDEAFQKTIESCTHND